VAAAPRYSVVDYDRKYKKLVAFTEWAASRWDQIHNIFAAEDRCQYVVDGSIGRHGLMSNQWEQALRRMGFQGDCLVVFNEIAVECRNEKLDRRRWNAGVETYDTISLRQLNRFEKRVKAKGADALPGEGGPPANRFIQLLRQQRGTLLRAWRLDLDKRGTGRVAYADFTNTCRRLGLAGQGRQIWNALRDDQRPLEFQDVAEREAVNLESFARTLWYAVGFDLDRAWNIMDVHGQKYLTLEEFQRGTQKLGFEGDAKLLFRGLDTSGLGRVWWSEFDYVQRVSQLAHQRLQQKSRGHVSDLITWVQRSFGGAEEFIANLGLACDSPEEVNISDLAARLTACGYDGDARLAAVRAARWADPSGTQISASALFTLLSGTGIRREGISTTTGKPLRPKQGPEPRTPTEGRDPNMAKQAWKDGVDNFSDNNMSRPKGVRAYFTSTKKSEERRGETLRGDASSASSFRPASRRRPGPGGTTEDRPEFDTRAPCSADVNTQLPASKRQYFSDPTDRPVREKVREELRQRNFNRRSRGAARPGGTDEDDQSAD